MAARPGDDRAIEADLAKDTPQPDVSDAAAEIGNTDDLADAERLADERALREADHQPDLPDRAFDRITPQV